MARLIGNNVILGNSGLNRKYMDDYLGAAQRSGDVLKGVGETVTAAEDSIADYLDRKKKQEEADYIRKRNAQQDLREIQRLDMEKRRYANEQAKHDAEMAAEKDAADAKAARKAYVESIYENEHDKRYESPEGRAAAQAYIEGDRDAFLKLRDRWNSADALKANEAAANSEKAIEKANEDLRKEVASLDIPLTKKEWEVVADPVGLEKTLRGYRAKAIEMGNREVQKDIESSLTALREGAERQQERREKGAKDAEAQNTKKTDLTF